MALAEPCPRVLFVGGFDPSGAAGVLADIKTSQEFCVYGTSATTAVTVQNRFGVSEVMSVPASVVGAQLDACFEDAPVDVIKTGMLVSADVIRALTTRVDAWGSRSRLVVDPVLRSTTGRSLLDEEGRAALVRELLPRAALVTPNLLEAEELTQRTAHNEDEMSRLGDHLLALGAQAVLIKGGHLVERDPSRDEIVDILRTLDGEEFRLRRPRLTPAGARGTGCSLAAAIASGLAEGLTLRTAVESACDFVHLALRHSALTQPVGALWHAARRMPSPLSAGLNA